jgi:hypothetical protein
MPPERLLFFGMAGAGKSKAAHSIACKLAATGSPARMFVLDTDYSWRRFLAAEGDPGNIILKEVGDWKGFVAGIQEAQRSGPGSWCVIDHIGVAWEMAQDSYIEQAYSKNPVEFLLDAKKNMKKNAGMGAALSGMGDWPFIKRMYRSAMNDLLYQSKVNVIGITTQEKIWETDGADTMATYNRLGGKPGGEKHLDYGFHSVIQCGQNYAVKQWWFTVAKDRGRQLVERQPVTDFSVDYLVNLGGWIDPARAMATAPTNGTTATETPAERIARIKAMKAAQS